MSSTRWYCYIFLKLRCFARRLASIILKSARRLSFVQTIPLNYMAAICVGSLVFELNSLSIILWRLCVHNKVHHAWLSSYWRLKCVHHAVKRAQLCCMTTNCLYIFIVLYCDLLVIRREWSVCWAVRKYYKYF